MPLSVRRQGSASFVSSGILYFELAFFPLCITLFINYSICSIKTVLRNLYEADESRTRIACQRALPAIFAFFALIGDCSPTSKKVENISKSTADRCFTVLPEQIFVQARQSSRRILVVLSRALTQHGRKSARQNRYVFDFRQLKLLSLDRVFAKTVDKPGNMAYDTYSKNPIWAIGIERSGDHA